MTARNAGAIVVLGLVDVVTLFGADLARRDVVPAPAS
jgi:hypothetical protein